VISFLLGLLATPAFFFGILPFDVNGQPVPLKGIVSGSAAVALSLTVCQFLVVRRSGREADAGAAATGMCTFTAGERPRETSVLLPGSLLLAMLAPVAGMCCLGLLLDPKPNERDAPALMSAGITGVLAGAAQTVTKVTRKAYRITIPSVDSSALAAASTAGAKSTGPGKRRR
jgi:hypothetical protein